MRKIAAMLASAAISACSVVGIREAEEPKYNVVDRIGSVEIREYGPCIAAETAVGGDEMAARSAGFRRLAGYIFGHNRSSAKLAMTAPVAQSSETIAMTAPVAQAKDATGQWVIRFFMPAKYTMATLPVPLDPAVRLVDVPRATVAVLRFSFSTSPDSVATRQQQLLQHLADSAWQPAGAPVAWFYDPPWTLPPLKRNEVAVPVTRR